MRHGGKANLAASSHGASRVPTGIQGVFALVVLGLIGCGQDARSNIGPSTVVERFLLWGGQRIATQVTDKHSPGTILYQHWGTCRDGG